MTRSPVKFLRSLARLLVAAGRWSTPRPRLRRGQAHHLLHVRLPLRHQRPPEGRRHPLHRGQPRSPGQPRRASAARAPPASCSTTRPARLRKPLLRIGERGAGEFREIEWDEALATAAEWLRRIRATDPQKLAFFTGRDQSQSLTGWWATQFGTPNFAAHGGFCSVNMAAAGLYTIGGSFWEFGEPDWERTKYFLMFGVAEDHDSNPIKIGLGKLKARGAKFVSVNPVPTGYSAIADEWIGIRPGTDGLFVLSLIHELLQRRPRSISIISPATPTPPGWSIHEPGAADDGLFVRDDEGEPLGWDRDAARAVDAAAAGIAPRIDRRGMLPDGRRARAGVSADRRALSRRRAMRPRRSRRRCGIAGRDDPPHRAPSSPHVAFDAGDRAAGRRGPIRRDGATKPCVGRPVAMHAMRGISAHSNGFQTCRAMHLLQMLLGADRYARAVALQVALSRSRSPPGPKPAGKGGRPPNTPLAGMPLGFPTGPGGLLIEADGTPERIDKAYSWDAPLAAHGLMHTGDRQRLRGRSLQDRHAVHVHGEHGVELGDEHRPRPLRMLTDKDPTTGAYKIPHIIYSDAYFSETVAYADLVLPDTTYLERWDCISLLDRPIGSADGAGRCDPPAGAAARPRRAAVPGRADRSRRAARTARLRQGRRQRRAIRRLRRLHRAPRTHARHRAARRLARRRRRRRSARARRTPISSSATSPMAASGDHELPPRAALLSSTPTRAYLDGRSAMGLIDSAEPDRAAALQSSRCRNSASPRRGTAPCQPPDAAARADRDAISIRCRSGIRRSRTSAAGHDGVPAARDHAAADARCTIPGARRTPGCGRSTATTGFTCTAAPRARSASRMTTGSGSTATHGRVKGQVRLMEGVNPDTVWTWNAIGKRAGAWNLSDDAPEVAARLPAEPRDLRVAARRGGRLNTDPVTGQAAWYDLRVRVEQAPPPRPARRAPHLPPLPRRAAAAVCRERRRASCAHGGQAHGRRRRSHRPAHAAPARRSSASSSTSTPASAATPAPSNCKEWNTGGHPAPLTDFNRVWRRSRRRLVQPRPHLRGRRRRGQPHRAFPALLPALRGAGLRHRLSDRRLLQARRGRHRAGQRGHLHRLQAVLLGLPLRRARVRRGRGRDEEMHPVHRPHLQREPGRGGTRAGLRRDLPDQRAAFRRSRRSRTARCRNWSPSAAASI